MTQNQTMQPSFFIVGAAKAGTTTLYHALAIHPEVFLSPRVKETNYFALNGAPAAYTDCGAREVNATSVHKSEAYRALFRDAGDRICGEVCPSYLYYPQAAAAIHVAHPTAKIIMCLRDPVDRAFSAYRHMQSIGSERAPNFEAALALEEEHIRDNWQFIAHYLACSSYYRQVKRYFDLFGPENVLVVDFEDLKRTPIQVLNRIEHFIGASPTHGDSDIATKNRTIVIKNRVARRCISTLNASRVVLRPFIPKRYRHYLRDRIYSLFSTKSEPLSLATRVQLDEAFAPDVAALEALIGTRFPRWLKSQRVS